MKKATLKDIEDTFSRTKSEGLVLDPKSEVSAIVSYFLRAIKGDISEAEIFSEKDSKIFSEQIENVRNLISRGKADEASKILQEVSSTSDQDQGEIILETMRIALLKNTPSEALKASDRLRIQKCHPVTAMTILQLRGDAFLKQKQYEQSFEELNKAIHLSLQFPVASSGISARTFLIKGLSEKGNRDAAAEELKKLRAIIDSQTLDCQWLDHFVQWIRAETHFLKSFGTRSETVRNLCEAHYLARWLGDAWTVKNCLKDIETLQVSEIEIKAGHHSILSFVGWSYIARHHLLLVDEPKTVRSLSSRKMQHKMLESLGTEPLEIDEFFQKVWGLSYFRERHDIAIRQALSKLRKLVPKGAVIQSARTISLK